MRQQERFQLGSTMVANVVRRTMLLSELEACGMKEPFRMSIGKEELPDCHHTSSVFCQVCKAPVSVRSDLAQR